MKDEFHLQALLDLRERERDDASADVGRAQADVDRTEDAIASLTSQKAETNAQRARAREDIDTDLARMQRIDEYIRALDVEIRDAAQKIEEHQNVLRHNIAVLRSSQEVLAQAQVAVKAVEQKREQWLEQRRAKAARAEEEEADEIGLRQWKDRHE